MPRRDRRGALPGGNGGGLTAAEVRPSYARLAVFAAPTGIRHRYAAAFGASSNVRIVVPPKAPFVRRSPNRFTKRPNARAVAPTLAVAPVLSPAPSTLAVFFPGSLLVLATRIRLENAALAATSAGAKPTG